MAPASRGAASAALPALLLLQGRWHAAAAGASLAVAPDKSLRTIPAAYLGGYQAARGGRRADANIQMLAKMRIVMIEKWEGHCYQECMDNSTAKPPLPCMPACNVEGDMLDTLKRVKEINPRVTGVFYLNLLLAFSFYSLVGRVEAAGALLVDAQTGAPVELVNDEGMRGVYVYDFGKAEARELYLDFVRGLLSSGYVDGLFVDKWPAACKQVGSGPDQRWAICNNVCGTVSEEQAQAYNAGATQVREALADMLQVATTSTAFGGLLYADDLSADAKCCDMAATNLVGPWQLWAPSHPLSPAENTWKLISQVHTWLHECNYSYVYLGCGDHMNRRPPDPGDPDDLKTDCTQDHIALFLLVVERGVFLGTNGWDAAFDRALGDPLGPLANVTDAAGNITGLTRAFSSGTNVSWDLGAGTGQISWADEGVRGRAHLLVA